MGAFQDPFNKKARRRGKRPRQRGVRKGSRGAKQNLSRGKSIFAREEKGTEKMEKLSPMKGGSISRKKKGGHRRKSFKSLERKPD